MSKDLVQQQFGANAAAYLTSTVHAKGASLARLEMRILFEIFFNSSAALF